MKADSKIQFNKKFIASVTTLNYNMCRPEDYAKLVNPFSSYQLIPGILNQFMINPWSIILQLLPLSKNTIIDVVLPFFLKSQDGQDQGKVLGRYFLFKQKVIGIKLCPDPDRQKQRINSLMGGNLNDLKKYNLEDFRLPREIIKFYEQKGIQHKLRIPIGQFVFGTNQFKIAPLFQSQLSNFSILNNYYKLGCEVFSVVGNMEMNQQYFVERYSNQIQRQYIKVGHSKVIQRLKDFGIKKKLILLYGGCKIAANLQKIYYSNSFISESHQIQVKDINCFTLNQKVGQNDYAQSTLSITKLFQVKNSQIYFMQNLLLKEDSLQLETQEQLPSAVRLLECDKLKCISQVDQNKYYFMKAFRQKIIESQQSRIFNGMELSGQTMIKCMYLFNLYHQFNEKNPFLLSVPFTKKSYNTILMLSYIYDAIIKVQCKFDSLQKRRKFSQFVQIYKYEQNYVSDQEQKLLNQIQQAKNKIKIVNFEQFCLKSRDKKIFLYTDDKQEIEAIKHINKQNKRQIIFAHFLLPQNFQDPLYQFRQNQKSALDQMLQLSKFNSLAKFKIKIREQSKKQVKKERISPLFVKAYKQITHMHKYTNINDIIQYLLEMQMTQSYIENFMADYFRNKTIQQAKNTPLHNFFIHNNRQKIILDVHLIIAAQQEKNNIQKLIELQSTNLIDLISDQEQQNKKKSNNLSNEDQTVNSQQQFKEKLQKCRQAKQKCKARQKQTVKCHNCQCEINKKLVFLCKKCKETVCIACFQQIAGDEVKNNHDYQKRCRICKKLCNCSKCLKRQLGKLQQPQAFIKNQYQNILKISQSKKQLGFSMSMMVSDSKNNKIYQVCSKCQILGTGQRKIIKLQCTNCHIECCYFCTKEMYKNNEYKQTNNRLYINWKCSDCDDQFLKFMTLKKEREEQRKRKEQLQKTPQQIVNFETNSFYSLNQNQYNPYIKSVMNSQIDTKKVIQMIQEVQVSSVVETQFIDLDLPALQVQNQIKKAASSIQQPPYQKKKKGNSSDSSYSSKKSMPKLGQIDNKKIQSNKSISSVQNQQNKSSNALWGNKKQRQNQNTQHKQYNKKIFAEDHYRSREKFSNNDNSYKRQNMEKKPYLSNTVSDSIKNQNNNKFKRNLDQKSLQKTQKQRIDNNKNKRNSKNKSSSSSSSSSFSSSSSSSSQKKSRTYISKKSQDRNEQKNSNNNWNSNQKRNNSPPSFKKNNSNDYKSNQWKNNYEKPKFDNYNNNKEKFHYNRKQQGQVRKQQGQVQQRQINAWGVNKSQNDDGYKSKNYKKYENNDFKERSNDFKERNNNYKSDYYSHKQSQEKNQKQKPNGKIFATQQLQDDIDY